MWGFFLIRFEYISHNQQPIHGVNPFLSRLPGAVCRNLRAGRGGRGQEVSGEFQEVAAGRDDPGDRGRGGLAHRPETPVKGDNTTTFLTLVPYLLPSLPSTYTPWKLK